MSSKRTTKHLVADRHPVRDFFVADIFDAAVKDDLASMEHPLFALRAGDKRVREYKHNDLTVTIKPGPDGLATIHDKDIWIFCTSQLIEAINRGREDVSRTVRFTAYEFLVATNRNVDGDSYRRLGDALSRLAGTRIETNIETAGQRERQGFGLIDAFRIVERDGDQRMVAIEVDLPRWLWRSIEAKHVLTLSRDYFRLRKPLDRRIYELARKHTGHQRKWQITMTLLHKKAGSTAPLRNFRSAVRSLVESNDLPDYRMAYRESDDVVVFYARDEKGALAQIQDVIESGSTQLNLIK